MAVETQQAKSHKDKVRERLANNRPDLNLDDEDAMYGAISEDYDNYDNYASENENLKSENSKYQKQNQQLADFISSGENNQAYLDGFMNGKDAIATAIEIHGRDGLIEFLNDEDVIAKYQEEQNKFEENLKKKKELQAEADKNLQESTKNIQAAIDAGEFTEEEATEAINGLYDMHDAMVMDKVEVEWVKMWLKAKNHDSDVDAAREEGHLNGVNEGIDKQMEERNRPEQGKSRINMPIAGGSPKGGNGSSRGGSLANQLFG